MRFENSLEFVDKMDRQDPLREVRQKFHFPRSKRGEPALYFCGNSLGLQPKRASEYVNQELEDWAKYGVEGHFLAKNPWYPYHEFLTDSTAHMVGARPAEVVVMNSLTVNLHLMLISFFRPQSHRNLVLMEDGAFPSDRYAVASHCKLHGLDSKKNIIFIKPRPEQSSINTEELLEFITTRGEQICLILLGHVNFLTGQAFEIPRIAKAAQEKGCYLGLDLAHGAGNLNLSLHDDEVDFAVWCSYKYLNAGPGAIGGCFVHEKHINNQNLQKLQGWWGHDKVHRFKFGENFSPIPSAESWQISNPPIFQLAALRASMEIFEEAQMKRIGEKRDLLTGYLEFILKDYERLTPTDPRQRGAQISIRIKNQSKEVQKTLGEAGVICDLREPDILRIAPAPLYNSFRDIYDLGQILFKTIPPIPPNKG